MMRRIIQTWIIVALGCAKVYTGRITDPELNDFVQQLQALCPSSMYSPQNIRDAANFLTNLPRHKRRPQEEVDEGQAVDIIQKHFVAHKFAVRVIGQTGEVGYVPGYAWYFNDSKQIVRVTDLIMQPKNEMSSYTLGGNRIDLYVNGSIAPQGFSVQVITAPPGDSIFDTDPKCSFLVPLQMDTLNPQAPDFDPEAFMKRFTEITFSNVPNDDYFSRPSIKYRPTTFMIIRFGSVTWTMDDLNNMGKIVAQMPESMQAIIQEEIEYLESLYDFRAFFGFYATIPFYRTEAGIQIIAQLAALDGRKYASKVAQVRVPPRWILYPIVEGVIRAYAA